LAGQQDQIAAGLHQVAVALAGDQHTAGAFEAAAAAAGATAQDIRAGQNRQAEAQSRETERAIAQAIRIAAATGADTLEDVVHDLELRVADLKDRQGVNLTDLQDLRKPSVGGEADRPARDAKIAAVAVAEAEFKQDIEEIHHELEALTVPTDALTDRADEHTAREDLNRALGVLRTSNTRQDAIDATINVRSGEFAGAGQSMARAQQGLEETYAQIVAAGAALSAGQSQAKRDYQALQRVSSGLRQIVSAAEAFTAPTQDAHAAPRPLPAAIAPVLDASVQRLRRDLLDTVSRANATPMPGLAEVRQLAQKPPELDRDLSGSLDQLRTLIQSIETLEGQLAAAMENEQQRAATRDFLKDPIPSAYQKRVSEYFQALSQE
jgi:hypothetical protein